MSWFSLPIDLAIALVGICIGEVDALRRFARRRKPVKHQHAWEPWELTGERTLHYGDRLPIQQRACLGCGYTEREMVAH